MITRSGQKSRCSTLTNQTRNWTRPWIPERKSYLKATTKPYWEATHVNHSYNYIIHIFKGRKSILILRFFTCYIYTLHQTLCVACGEGFGRCFHLLLCGSFPNYKSTFVVMRMLNLLSLSKFWHQQLKLKSR